MLLQFKVWLRPSADPCDLLVPSWVTVAVRGPFVLYFVAYPLLHFVMTAERGWATLRVHQYENVSVFYGVLSVCAAVNTQFYALKNAPFSGSFHSHLWPTSTTLHLEVAATQNRPSLSS